MKKTYFFFGILWWILQQPSVAQISALRQKISQIVAQPKATVGVSIWGPNAQDTLSFHGNDHLPMQSVFKFHIALAVLAQVDKGKFRLDQPITIQPKDLLPKLYSPLREKYPKGATLPLSEILTYAVSQSDNVGCDVLLRLLGGSKVVEQYFVNQHFTDISIKINEETMQNNWDLQYQNWTTPNAANRLLMAYYTNKPQRLSKSSHAFIWNIMKGTTTGLHRLREHLPKGTVIAHKTGTSGTNTAGLLAATNDIGLIFLPDGRPVYVSVFVSDSHENEATNEKIIADIGKAIWEHFTGKSR